jgi:hypothetical protein
MLEWGRQSNYVGILAPVIRSLAEQAWREIVRDQRALLRTPALTIPAIETALASERPGMAFVAELLLAAEPAVSVNLSSEFRGLLKTIMAG